ncbi:MAG: amylo-alpha-1,6-glucosidase [Candidatus Riflebacteria bacterium]|nr:amylo-alpha-1,6-glucosidase [Candidatus Riflebacteria bacterium]
MTTVGREIQSDLTRATRQEWILTNGIGGFASSTVPCINTRRYHGVLVAARRPPVERLVLVSRLEETLTIDRTEYSLSTCVHQEEIKNPAGYLHLERFEREPVPTWYYQIRDVMLIKTMSMVYGQNTTLVTYKLLANGRKVSLRIRPHYLFRDFHGNMYESAGMEDCAQIFARQMRLQPFANAPELFIRWDRGKFVADPKWHKDILLQTEEDRGLPALEDDFSCGYLEVSPLNGSVSMIFSDQPLSAFNPMDLKKREEQRLENIASSLHSSDPLLRRLLLAADQFIVERQSTGSRSIIAGYPWFSDWGRDSLISLPGLTLVTGRFDDARSILKTFAMTIQNGLVANCFADSGNEAAYNSVDASLWFFIAAYKLIEYTDDYDFVREYLFEGMTSIIEDFERGTRFEIKMDAEDGLIRAGTSDVQLTWMDAKVDGWVVTPRNGKAVEINALWYNALKIYALFQEKFEGHSRDITALAKKVKSSFRKEFWNSRKNWLFDCIKPDGSPDLSFRPNQIFAVFLPFALLDHTEEKAVVDAVFAKLYTSYGLRSLSPKDERYEGFYGGDRIKRDGAYHQGTAWGFLIGPFISSYLKVNNFSMESQLRASLMIEPFINHMNREGCIGSISEIFDGNMPHTSRGCFAQAWSVAELLRCYIEDIKGQKPTIVI